MAGLGRRIFAAGEVLTAGNVMGYLQDQAVMTFAGTAARGSAIGTAVSEGMVSYLADTNAVEVYRAAGTATPGWERIDAPQSVNYVINGGFDVFQRGTSGSIGGSVGYSFDHWQSLIYAGGTMNWSVNDAFPNGAGTRYALRVQRPAGGTNTASLSTATSFEAFDVISMAGKKMTLSFYARAGANYSPTGGALYYAITWGTSADQSVFNGITGATDLVRTTVALTTSWQRFTATVTVPSNALSLGIAFYSAAHVGTAGAADYYDLTGVQFEEGLTATSFRRRTNSYQAEVVTCQRYYENRYYYGTGWGQNSTQVRTALNWLVKKRASPSVSFVSGTIQYGPGGTLAIQSMPAYEASPDGTFITYTMAGGQTVNLPSITAALLQVQAEF